MSLSGLTITEFMEKLARPGPSPAGGSAAALAGASAAALVEMTASLAAERAKEGICSMDLEELSASSAAIRNNLLELLDEDAEVFPEIVKANRLPDETLEEKEIKKIIRKRAFKRGVEVPLAVLEECVQLASCIEKLAGRGIPAAQDDERVAQNLTKACVASVSAMIMANLGHVNEEPYARKVQARVDSLNKDIESMCKRAEDKRVF